MKFVATFLIYGSHEMLAAGDRQIIATQLSGCERSGVQYPLDVVSWLKEIAR